MADGKATIEQLVARVFASRNAAHLTHWTTKSYSQHAALGEFYDGVIDQIDAIVEDYQGTKGLIKVEASSDALISKLEQEAKWIGEMREALSGGVPSVLNKIDDLQGIYTTALYKLKTLK